MAKLIRVPDLPEGFEEKLKEIEERAKKATPGPWEETDGDDDWDLYGWFPNDPKHKLHPKKIIQVPKGTCRYWPDKEDADFIIHSREDIPFLLTFIKQLLPPQIKTEEHAKKIKQLLGWAYTYFSEYPYHRIHKKEKWDESIFDMQVYGSGDSEMEAINAALKTQWIILTPAKRERITQIVKGE